MSDSHDVRKRKEAEFHDQRELDRTRMSEEEWHNKYANKKWYSINRQSRAHLHSLIKHYAPGAIALDYCCGLGGTALELAEAGAIVHGIDISPQSIATAEARLEHAGYADRSKFQVMDAEALEFPDDTFDLVTCIGVLHHLDLTRAFPEIARVVKRGGVVVCVEALGYNPIINLYRRRTPQLRTEWEAEHILTLREVDAARAHFDDVDIRFHHLAAIAAVPLRRTRVFEPVLWLLEKVDAVLLRIPGLRRMAWQMTFVLSSPRHS